MSRLTLPTGDQNSLEKYFPHDINSSVQIFGAHYRRVKSPWAFPFHKHYQMYEVNYILEGYQLVELENQSFTQGPGDILFIKPGQSHNCCIDNSDTMVKFGFHFSVNDELLNRLLQNIDPCLITSDSAFAYRVKPSLDEMKKLILYRDPNRISQCMKIQSAFFQLMNAISEEMFDSRGCLADLKNSSTRIAHRIAEGIEQLAGRLSESTSIEDDKEGIQSLAKEMGLSPAHCYRIFQNTYGMSPRKYLSEILQRKAKLLLANTEYSIEDIAILLGYKDSTSFSKQFKKWTGECPSGYRQRQVMSAYDIVLANNPYVLFQHPQEKLPEQKETSCP